MMPSSIPHSTISPLPSSSSSTSATSSPCAACKFLRRKCQPDCVFAPYFPPDNPQKFVHVHRVFGASNVTKILNELPTCQREDAVNSLAYEADMRLKDPVYGCVGVISILQHQLRQLQIDLNLAKAELSKYQNSHSLPSGGVIGNNYNGVLGLTNTGGYHHHHHHHHPYYQQQQQQQMMLRGFEAEVARMGVNGGGYGDGIVAAAAAVNGGVTNGGMIVGQFLRANTTANAGEDRPSIGPS